MKGFWGKLPRPFFVLAPLADVTDPAFRRVIAACGAPDAMWTEFISADGLARAPEEGRKKLLADLQYTEGERPIVAQFFTSNPAHMEQAAALARELGFDGVDINMGCPDKSIEKQGAGAAHIKDPKRAQEVIYAAMRGAQELPVSIKTRLGYNTDELETWLPALLEAKPAAVTIHARTRKEMSKVPARWERVKRAVEIRNELQSDTLILGNGDLTGLDDARAKVAESGADGAMLGRAIFGTPWLFAPLRHMRKSSGLLPSVGQTFAYGEVSLGERLKTLAEHSRLFEELLPHKSFAIMKKHFKAYVKDFDGAAELRAQLMDADNAEHVERTISTFENSPLKCNCC